MSAVPVADVEQRARYERKVERLSQLSADGPHDAYDDVPWDEPGYELDPTDPRLGLFSFDPLARTRWYQTLEPIEQARVGLRRLAVNLRTGWEFENFLQQGLLIRTLRMDNTDVAFRYSHYEIAEESHHSMMFYEFVRRYAPEVEGMPRGLRGLTGPTVHVAARRYPALFFLLVLGGEVPIDHMQRLVLREEHVHPLVERIMTIHVEEEARHVGFANLELRRIVPEMSRAERRRLAAVIPEFLGIETRLMVFPSLWQRRHDGVPRDDARAALRSPESRQLLADSISRVRNLCIELDLVTPESQVRWERVGLWDRPKRPAAA